MIPATRVAASCTVFAAGRRHVHQHTPAGIRVNKVRNHTRITVGGADARQEERIPLLSATMMRYEERGHKNQKNRDRKIEHDEANASGAGYSTDTVRSRSRLPAAIATHGAGI